MRPGVGPIGARPMRVFRDDDTSGTRGGPGPGIGAPGALVVPAALIAGIVAFALARVALLPGLGFWDTGEFQTVGPVMGTAHPTGFPAYVLLGWLVSALLTPFGEPAFRMNLLSALLVAGGVGLTVVLVTQLTGRVWLAFASGLLLAAIPVVWNIATHADAHALHFFLVALLLVVLVGWEQRVRAAGGMFAPGWGPAPGRRARLARPGDRWLVAAAIVYGVGLATHSLMLLLAPGVGLFVLATAPGILRRVRFILGLAAAVLGTALLLYLELPIRAGLVRAPLVYGHPETLDGFLYVVLGQQFVGALYQPFTDLGQKVIDLACVRPRPARTARPARAARVRGDGETAAALRAPDRGVVPPYHVVRIVLRQCRHRALLPGPGDHRRVRGSAFSWRPSWTSSPA